jgi:hypothetical protein
MFDRYNYMKKSMLQLSDKKPIFVMIDEFATIEHIRDKQLKNEIMTSLINLLQKGRAARIIFIFAGQKIDTKNIDSSILTNLDTKVLFKTSGDNVEKIIKVDEQNELGIFPSRFISGRCVFESGLSSEKTLLQVPLLSGQEFKRLNIMSEDKNEISIDKSSRLKDIKMFIEASGEIDNPYTNGNKVTNINELKEYYNKWDEFKMRQLNLYTAFNLIETDIEFRRKVESVLS